MKHVDLIEDPTVKEYIKAKKEDRMQKKLERQTGIHKKMAINNEDDIEMEDSEEEEVKPVKVKAVAKVKQTKIKSKAIKKWDFWINTKLIKNTLYAIQFQI